MNQRALSYTCHTFRTGLISLESWLSDFIQNRPRWRNILPALKNLRALLVTIIRELLVTIAYGARYLIQSLDDVHREFI
jgi:hypothetical protein